VPVSIKVAIFPTGGVAYSENVYVTIWDVLTQT